MMAQQPLETVEQPIGVIKNVEDRRKLSPQTLRLNEIYQDYSKGTTAGLDKFAEAIKMSRTNTYYMITGAISISKKVYTSIQKLGYSASWLISGEGPMMLDKKSRSSITDIVEVKAQVNTLIAQLQKKDLRMAGMEKEIDALKKDIKDIKKMLADNKIHYQSH